MHGSHNREQQGDDCAGALVRCGSARVHGGERAGSPNVAGLPFHNQPINERGSHGNQPSHWADRVAGSSLGARLQGIEPAVQPSATWAVACSASPCCATARAEPERFGQADCRPRIKVSTSSTDCAACSGLRLSTLARDAAASIARMAAYSKMVSGCISCSLRCAMPSGLAGGGLGFAARWAARKEDVFFDGSTRYPLNRGAVIRLPRPFGTRKMASSLPLADCLAADLQSCSQNTEPNGFDCLGDWVHAVQSNRLLDFGKN